MKPACVGCDGIGACGAVDGVNSGFMFSKHNKKIEKLDFFSLRNN